LVPWWKKLSISLVSWIAGSILGAVVTVLAMAVANPPPLSRAIEPLQAVMFMAPFFLIFSFLGWVAAIPVVLIANSFCRWRLWLYLALGTCIGPILYLALGLYSFLRSKTPIHIFEMPPQFIVVSFLTTLIYLLLIRRAQAAAIRKRSAATVESAPVA
jgi:hypothetical protein